MKAECITPPIGWMTDRNGLATFVSPGWLRHTGKSAAESRGKGWLADIHPDDRGEVAALMSNPPGSQKPVDFIFRMRHFSGAFSEMRACASPGLSASGEFAGWAAWVSPVGDSGANNPLFELLSNNMREIVCLLSKDAQIQYVSPAVETILGYTPEELIGQVFPPSIIPAGQRPDFSRWFTTLLETKGAEYIEVCVPSRAGEPVWLELDLRFLRDEQGELANLQVVARDVSQRKQIEQMLYLQNDVAAILWETTDLNSSLSEVLKVLMRLDGVDCGGIYLSDAQSHDLDLICHEGLSPAYIQAVRHYDAGHNLVELCRKGDPIYIHFPELVERMKPEPFDVYAKEGLRGFAAFPVVHNQELIAVFNLASRTLPEIPSSSRKVLEFLTRQIGALIARNQAENALRESEEKFRSFFEQSTDIMSLVDENGVIAEWNPSSEELTGLTKAEAVGQPSVDVQFDLLPTEKKTALMYRKMVERYASVQHKGKSSFLNRILEGQVLDKSGRQHFFQQVIFPIRTRKGVMLGSTGRDVTHLKKVEEAELEQRRLTEALIDSAAVLNSSLILDEIINSIFTLIERVVPNQGGALMLVNPETGLVRVSGYLGTKTRSMENFGNEYEFPAESVPVLKLLAESRQPIIIPDTLESQLWKNFHSDQPTRSFVGVPILSQKEVIGFLTLTHSRKDSFQPKHADWLMAFANQAAMAIENARLFGQVEALAVQDELTRVYNRRGLKELGEREVARAVRFNHPLSALFLDVDHFKDINDRHSHSTGDQVLRAVASCIHEFLRSVDVAGRYGGEEFVLLLPETDQDGAAMIAERLRAEIEKIFIKTPRGDLGVTVSIGVASLGGAVQSLEELLDKADAAVHRAKAGGRNRVEVG